MGIEEIVRWILVGLLAGFGPYWLNKTSRKKVSDWCEENGYKNIESIQLFGCGACLKRWCINCSCVVATKQAENQRVRICLKLGGAILSPVKFVALEKL